MSRSAFFTPDTPAHAGTVYIVDDDAGIRFSLRTLLETAELTVQCFASAEDFLHACSAEQRGCVLLDVRMPGMSGPELQEQLALRGVTMPIMFLTAYADLGTGVEAIKQGATDFLTKPINGALLLERVHHALKLDRVQRQAATTRRQFELRLAKLTRREREVLLLALAGRVNKEISAQLGVSLRTIEGHRSRIFLKTGVSSLLELAQEASQAGVTLAELINALEQMS